MKVRQLLSWVLVCTMVMSQTVWAQDVSTESTVQNNQEQESEYVSSDPEEDDLVAEESWEDDQEQAQEISQGENETQDENDISDNDGQETDAAELVGEMLTNSEADDTEKQEAETVETVEDTQKEKTVDSDTRSTITEEDVTICVNYPIMINTRYGYSGTSPYTVECEDETICKISSQTYLDEQGYNRIYFTLEGVQPGTTRVNLKYDDEVKKIYNITVNELPEDAVMFQDIALRTRLCSSSYYDKNADGCISKDELAQIYILDLSVDEYSGMYTANSIKDLSGLEYATNLHMLNLEGNSEFSDISLLLKMSSLSYIGLEGTAVSAADRFKLADFKDQDMVKGEKITPASMQGELFDDTLSIECVEGEECVKITAEKASYSSLYQEAYTYYVTAQEAGEARLKISYYDYSTEITIKIQGIAAEQEVGEEYDAGTLATKTSAESGGISGQSLILDSNNQLWSTYPTGQKLKNNVKDYVATWVYYGDAYEADGFDYILDEDNVLWNGDKKLAEDVVKFDGRYALDSKDTLKNIYNAGSEEIEGVEDWINPSMGSKGIVYILKKDGTLWSRQEVASDQSLSELTLFDSDVVQITSSRYLKKDGTVWYYSGTQLELDVNVQKLDSDFYNAYYDTEGNYYCYYYYSSSYSYEYGYANVGSLDIKNISVCSGASYILTQDNNLYKYDVDKAELSLLSSNVLRINSTGFGDSADEKSDWAFQGMDGTYYDRAGEEMSYLRLMYAGASYDLMVLEDGTQMVEKNGVDILDNVIQIWRSYTSLYFALRTDGTVWNITGIPEKVLDLSQSSESEVSDAAITLSSDSYTYDGTEKKPTVTIKDGDTTLVQDTDYTVSYADNVNAGTASVTITGTGNYAGTKTVQFKIKKAAQSLNVKLSASTIVAGKTAFVTVTGNKGKITYKAEDKNLVTVSSSGKVTAGKVGTTKITVTASETDNYKSASKTLSVKITPAATTSMTLSSTAAGTKVSWKKVTGATGYYIYRSTSGGSYSKIKTVTSGSTVTYTDTGAKKNGTKYQYKIYAYASTGTGAVSGVKTSYYITAPTLSSVKNTASKKMTVTWKKNAKVTGYQIKYVTGSTTKTITVKGASSVSKVISNLTKNKTYIVYIRGYKTVSGTNYYSAWSSAKSLKITK